MSDYSVTNYNPNNINDTLYTYQSNRTVATNPIQQVPKTNYASSVSLEIPPDTFELSAESKIRGKSEKKGMSTGLKALLWIGGTAAAVYGAVVGHRALTKLSIEKVAKNFSEIFRRDVSKEEAQKLVNNYKEILNIENAEEFYNKVFEQVKKDYGYEKLNIPLVFKESNSKAAAGWEVKRGEVFIFRSKDKPISRYERKRTLINLIHEFQHAKQSEYQYRTSPAKTLKALDDNSTRRYFAQILDYSEETIEKIAKSMNMSVKDFRKMIIEECKKDKVEGSVNKNGNKLKFDKEKAEKRLQELFGHLTPFEKGSKEYELGLKYIENESKYIPHQIDEVLYKKQLLEAEAYGTEPKFEEIYNSFANIWRIPFFQ